MQIRPNYLFQNNTIYQTPKKNTQRTVDSSINRQQDPINLPLFSYGLTFGMSHDANILLNNTHRLVCAYSGREMLSPKEYSKICDKLKHKPNLQSATRYLYQYQKDFMHPIESEIFDMLNSKEMLKYHGNKTFKDILMMERPASLERLKSKQLAILTSTDKIIAKMNEPVANMIRIIRDKTIENVNNDTFSRKSPLDMLHCIKTQARDKELLDLIYQKWYMLPSSSNDYDAFIVKYAKNDHEQIAARLLSRSVATIEHIIPRSKNGSSSLSNYLLVSADYNNERSSESLSRYIALHKDLDIPRHLQHYIDIFIREINDKNSPFHDYAWYPNAMAQAVDKETNGMVKLNVGGINIAQKEINEKAIYRDKLSKKYKIHK